MTAATVRSTSDRSASTTQAAGGRADGARIAAKVKEALAA